MTEKARPPSVDEQPDIEGKRVLPRLYDSNGLLQMAEGPWEEQEGCTTSNDALFVINHYDRPAEIAAENYTLKLFTREGGAHEVDFEALRSLPSVTMGVVMECAGMSRGFLPSSAPGQQFGHGLCGNAVWTGTSLKHLLDHYGAGLDFQTLVARGRDQGLAKPEEVESDFSKGLARLKALHPDTLLAWELNGEPIPHMHGGPVRLVVPGWFTTWWVKWVYELETIAGEYDGFWQTTRYSYQGNGFADPAVVTELLPRSLIVSPRDGGELTGDRIQARGYAWGGENAITAVELSLDRGRTWTPCALGRRCGRYGWLLWEAERDVPTVADGVTLSVRATDSAGRKQEWESRPNRLGYGNNGIHQITLSRNRAGQTGTELPEPAA